MNRDIFFVIAACVAAGCAWNEPVTFEQDARVQPMLSRPAPLHPYKLAVAPVRMTMNQEASADGRHTCRSRPEDLTARLLDAMKKMNLFAEIAAVGTDNPGATVEDLLAEAWEIKADLLLTLDLSRYEVYWVGNNGLYIPNLLWWAFAWEMSSFVDDETYGGGMDVEAGLYSVHSNKKIGTWPIRKDVSLDLNDFERGWIFLGFLRVPGALDTENWNKIDEVVTPRTELEVKVEMGHTLGETFQSVAATPAFTEKMSKTLALSIGIDEWDDYRLNWLRFAGEDASSFARLLTDGARGTGIPEKNTRVLVNEQAKLESIRREIREFLQARATPEDLVFIYYAGYGCPSKDGSRTHLLAFDTRADDIENTALSLAELKSLVDGIKARNVVLVLDCAFNSDEASRSAVRTVWGDRVAMMQGAIPDFGAEGRMLALACGADEGAQLFPARKHGMFTNFLIDGLEPKNRPADTDRDGIVTIEEFLNFAVLRTSDETSLSAVPQTPAVSGKPVGKPVLARFTDSVPPSDGSGDDAGSGTGDGSKPGDDGKPGDGSGDGDGSKPGDDGKPGDGSGDSDPGK